MEKINLIKSVLFCFLLLPFSLSAEEKDFKALAASEGLKEALSVKPPQEAFVLLMLTLHKYQQLDAYYAVLFQQYKENPLYESALYKGYNLFSYGNNGITQQQLDLWVKETKSASAYVARGYYYSGLGYEARGSAYRSKTSPEQFSEMGRLHALSFSDFKQAIELKPGLMPAYAGLIGIARASSQPINEKQAYDLALSQDKLTYYVRFEYILAQVPKWGGTIKEMAQVGIEAAQYSSQNPRLWNLQGNVDALHGMNAYDDDECSDTIFYYTNALRYGDRVGWLKNRGYCWGKVGEPQKALDDYSKILYYDPQNKNAMKWARKMKKRLSK